MTALCGKFQDGLQDEIPGWVHCGGDGFIVGLMGSLWGGHVAYQDDVCYAVIMRDGEVRYLVSLIS